jgi:hypothetical protein
MSDISVLSPEDRNRCNFKTFFLITVEEMQKRTHLITEKCKCKKSKVDPRTGHEGQEGK